MARKKEKPGSAFAVVRRGWDESYGEDWTFYPVTPEQHGRVLGRPLAVYTDRASAEAKAAELEVKERESINPFLFVGEDSYRLEMVTSLAPKSFLARLKKLYPGATLPKPGDVDGFDWYGWWAGVADGLSEEQRAAAWEVFDRLKFYHVLEAEEGIR